MQIFIPYCAFLGIPLFTTLRGAKDAGFHGVEIRLVSFRSKRDALLCRYRAVLLGLATHFHQGWSLEENPTHWHNHVLNALGYLPHNGYALADHIPLTSDPVVIYADRIAEARYYSSYWLQTCSQFARDGRYALSYIQFADAVRRHKLPVVFDTQHYLEYTLNVRGVEDLPQDRRKLFDLLAEGWQELGSFVKEIQLCDSDPRLGHTGGRNVFLGEGILPLRDFCQLVKESGWNGVVVPEVKPGHLLRPRRIGELRARVIELFS